MIRFLATFAAMLIASMSMAPIRTLPAPRPKHHPAAHGRYRAGFSGKARIDPFAGLPALDYDVTDGQGANGTVIQEGAQPAGQAGVIPFRRATSFRTGRLEQTSGISVTAAEQPIQITVEGSGFVWGIDVEFDIETAANAAAVAYHEDAPWNAISSVVYQDVNGELVNVPGFSLRVQNLYSGLVQANDQASTDVQVFEQVSGAVGRGGSVHAHLMVPIGTNWRTLLGLVGNQDRSQKYQLRTNFAASGSIYTTAPTAAGAITIQRGYMNFAYPQQSNAQGFQQQTAPPDMGVLHFITQTVSTALPVANSTQNHFLPRLGNTIRLLILIFRDGAGTAARTDAEANPPSLIKFLLGDTPLFAETAGLRRKIMRDRYGFDAPAGVYVYDFITDLASRAGSELGDDYLFTNGLNNAQFEVSYGAGWAAASSLTIVTDDLIIPPGVNIYD